MTETDKMSKKHQHFTLGVVIQSQADQTFSFGLCHAAAKNDSLRSTVSALQKFSDRGQS